MRKFERKCARRDRRKALSEKREKFLAKLDEGQTLRLG